MIIYVQDLINQLLGKPEIVANQQNWAELDEMGFKFILYHMFVSLQNSLSLKWTNYLVVFRLVMYGYVLYSD